MKWWIGAIAVLVIAVGIGLMNSSAKPLEGTSVALYQSMSCGCCVFYGEYLERAGAMVDSFRDDAQLAQMKEQLGIPRSVQSCHTVQIGKYFVEGHVPREAIEKLLREQPDIDGIALPGMPSGSPGMPGPKTGTWVIYAVKDGQVSEFMRI